MPSISMEDNYAKSVSLEHRKKYAQFFTPGPIAQTMAKWLLGNKGLYSVLEPAFGLGILSRELLTHKKNLQVKGFEIDENIFSVSKNHFNNNQMINLILQDYMYNDWKNKYDGIICNPPYFKFHDYDNKNIIKEIEERLGCHLNGFTNLYTLFLLKSIYQLNASGRCAYVVPSEFLNSNYGKLVKRHLIKTNALRHIIVIDFEENVFDGAMTTSSLILCANDNLTDKVQFTNIKSVNDLKQVNQIISNYPKSSDLSKVYSLNELNPEVKWKQYYQEQNSIKYKNLIHFSNYAKVSRGIATGANEFFAFNLQKAQDYSIKEKFLLPCVCRSVNVEKNYFDYSDFEYLKTKNKNVFLLNAKNAEEDVNVKNYLLKGQEQGIDKKYLTASRKPWYLIENRPAAPIWVSVFNRNGMRFVRNIAGVSNLTTFHCVYPNKQDLFNELDINILFAYLLTDTARSIFADNGREYGDGLQKFEPNDINDAKMIDLRLLSNQDNKKILFLYDKIRENNKERNDNLYIKEIDNILNKNFMIL
ncbi:MAG: SAM-dependent methyltransferase [Endomicrobium sp.]|jgi:adenine-specific DNA-methyltransferase|nr:SAM-dependent methyltransferase [Endomicrobium sp.]